MPRRPRTPRDVPLRFDDNFRGHVASAVSLVVPGAILGYLALTGGLPSDTDDTMLVLFLALCGSLTAFFAIYIWWTHKVFTTARHTKLWNYDQRRWTDAITQWLRSHDLVPAEAAS